MVRRLAPLWLVPVLLLPACASALASSRSHEDALPGRILLSGKGIELFNPATGDVRRVAERGNEPAFFPSGNAFAYIREGGCYPIGRHGGCYTEYSIFEKSFSERDPAARGRQVFGWTDFFVRAVDVAPRGRLVFSAKPGPGPAAHGKTMEIYSSALDGGHVRRLTHNHVFDNDPAVSPDGGHIAFARKVHGRSQIFSMRIDGSHPVRLTHDGGRDRLPAWSPDGNRIIFISQPPAASRFAYREVYTVAARGGPERRLTHNRLTESDPAYSPGGHSVAFLVRGDLWLMGADGVPPHRILQSPNIGGYEGGLDWGRS